MEAKYRPRFFLINQPYTLRGFKKVPYALQHYYTGKTDFFRREPFMLLMSCDGLTPVDEASLSDDEKALIRKWLDRDIIRECEKGEALLPYQRYRYYDVYFKKEVQWSITGKCNFRCRHCFMSAPAGAQGEPSWDELMIMLDAFERCGIRTIQLTGGEPLIRKDFWKLADEIRRRELVISTIYSNGLLVTDEFLDRLEMNQVLLDYLPAYFADGKPMPIALEGFYHCDYPDMEDGAYFEKDIPEEYFSKFLMCAHVRTGMYVSPQGRVLPCLSMVGEPIEQQFPSMLETPLEDILKDSLYMDIINTRISDFMEHNPDCAACEYRCDCCGGCRAKAVSDGSEDYLKPDPVTCEYFRGGWKKKKDELLKQLKENPMITSTLTGGTADGTQ